ncbi:MAG: hypothetical protein E7324_05880 [Clostridiales bacterium]|nr:hypothetical protein [Clostridiales bacterium]
MKKLIVFLLLSVMICVPCLGEEAGQPFTLRGDITFGLSMDEVMNREAARGIELIDSEEDYAREMRVMSAGSAMGLGYGFDADDRLAEIIYFFTDVTAAATGNEAKRDYSKYDLAFAQTQYPMLEKTLEEKYGPAQETDIVTNGYFSWELSQFGNYECYVECNRRLVPSQEGYVVIEHIIFGAYSRYYNVVTYEYMTAEAYENKLNEKQVQDYLNGIL